jgi:hypothetical protein
MSEQRWSHPGAGDVPGEDDMQTAPDEAMADPRVAAGTPQQTDPGGYPHEPADDVTQAPAGPGRDNAQTEPAEEEARRRKGSA